MCFVRAVNVQEIPREERELLLMPIRDDLIIAKVLDRVRQASATCVVHRRVLILTHVLLAVLPVVG